MKKLLIISLLVSFAVANAQFKDSGESTPNFKNAIINNSSSSSLFSFFNPDNFSMHHTFDLSYSAGGGAGLALGVYTNSMGYKFSDVLNIQTDISIVNSPYSSFGQDYSKQLNGVYLSRVQLNFKPADNMTIIVGYQRIPGGMYSPYSFGGGFSPFYRDSFQNDFGFMKER